MASIFRQQYTAKTIDPNTGKEKTVKKKSAYWYIDYKAQGGVRKRVKAFKDKSATAQLAAKLEKEAELAESGVIDRFKEHRKRLLKEHLEDWQESLRACGVTQKQVDQNYNRALRILTESSFSFWQDITASKTMQTIDQLQTLVRRKNKQSGKMEQYKTGPASSITKRHHLRAVKQFSKWMVADGRAPMNPLFHLTITAQVENPKRALSVAEIQTLLDYTETAPDSFCVPGPERALIYRFACETGLRAEEIHSLKRPSFDFEGRTVKVSAQHTKNRKDALLPLRASTMEHIQRHLSGKMPNAGAFRIPSGKSYCNAGRMLKRDIEKARAAWIKAAKDDPAEHRNRVESDFLKIKTSEGKLDFHALRHTCSSLLNASGTNAKVIQSHMRHATVDMTMSIYTHAQTEQSRAAVEALPEFGSVSQTEIARATGTDGKQVDCAYKPAYKKLAKNAVPEQLCMLPIVSGNSQLTRQDATAGQTHKSIKTDMLDTPKNSLSMIDTDENSTAPGGTRTPNPRFRRPMLSEHNHLENKELTDSSQKPLQTSLQKDSENRPHQRGSLTPQLKEIIDRWDTLPEHIKAAVMALVETQYKNE